MSPRVPRTRSARRVDACYEMRAAEIDGSFVPVRAPTYAQPSAYLVDEEGRAASKLQVGANAVPDLAQSVVERRLSRSRGR